MGMLYSLAARRAGGSVSGGGCCRSHCKC